MASVKRIEITHAEILEALNGASRPKVGDDPPGFFVASELSKSTGVCLREINNRLAVARRAGRVEVTKLWRNATDGRLYRVSAFRITEKKSA